MVAIRHGGESAVEWQDLKSVTGKVEATDNLGPQQRDDVRADRKLEAGKNFFRASRAAEDVAALEDEHFLSGFSQIGGVGEAVMASPNHDHVVLRTARNRRHRLIVQIDGSFRRK